MAPKAAAPQAVPPTLNDPPLNGLSAFEFPRGQPKKNGKRAEERDGETELTQHHTRVAWYTLVSSGSKHIHTHTRSGGSPLMLAQDGTRPSMVIEASSCQLQIIWQHAVAAKQSSASADASRLGGRSLLPAVLLWPVIRRWRQKIALRAGRVPSRYYHTPGTFFSGIDRLQIYQTKGIRRGRSRAGAVHRTRVPPTTVNMPRASA